MYEALGSAQPLTEMSTRNILWGSRRPVIRADTITIVMCRLSRNSGSLNLQESYGPVRVCNGIDLTLPQLGSNVTWPFKARDVRGSVHHSTIHEEKSNKMQQCIKILFPIYMKLNMFRATHRPSSGA